MRHRYVYVTYPCSIPGIDTCKNTREALDVDCISKYIIVEEVGPEMVMRFTWTKIVLGVRDQAIVNGQPFKREKVGDLVYGLCHGRRILDLRLCFVLESTVEATITGSRGPIKGTYSLGDCGSINLRHATTATATMTRRIGAVGTTSPSTATSRAV
jgi:hypothetical protein